MTNQPPPILRLQLESGIAILFHCTHPNLRLLVENKLKWKWLDIHTSDHGVCCRFFLVVMVTRGEGR